MREQMANGDSVPVAATERRDIVHDRVIEPDLLLIVEDHDGRRGADDLGERDDVVDGALGVYGGALLTPGKLAESSLEYRRALSADDDRSVVVASVLDTDLDDA